MGGNNKYNPFLHFNRPYKYPLPKYLTKSRRKKKILTPWEAQTLLSTITAQLKLAKTNQKKKQILKKFWSTAKLRGNCQLTFTSKCNNNVL